MTLCDMHHMIMQDAEDVVFNNTLPAGSCGYGQTDVRLWPFYAVAGVSPDSPLIRGRPQHGCGTCLELRCADTRKVCGYGVPKASVCYLIGEVCYGSVCADCACLCT